MEVRLVRRGLCALGCGRKLKKQTNSCKFMTSAKEIAGKLGEKCDRHHKDAHLVDESAGRVEACPDKLCYKIRTEMIDRIIGADRWIQSGVIC